MKSEIILRMFLVLTLSFALLGGCTIISSETNDDDDDTIAVDDDDDTSVTDDDDDTAADDDDDDTVCIDEDDDGYGANCDLGEDCDDSDSTIWQYCIPDADGDGYVNVAVGGLDCDDDNSAINPLAIDDTVDSVDQNCDDYDGPAPYWFDVITGLKWQNPQSDTSLNWQNAINYCDALSYGGHDDWRLPTLGELRTLILGCPETVTGGACGVTDDCLADTCVQSACACTVAELPIGGCFMDDELLDCSWFWSSSEVSDITTDAWLINFGLAEITSDFKTSINDIRCVR